MSKRTLVVAVLAVLGAGAWYAFRPERLFVNQRVSESLGDVSASTVLATGQFHGVHHDTKGTARVVNVGGSRVLQLTGFETSNGPDVRVYLVAANDANDNATVTTAGFVEVGALKGNIGDQNYDVPGSLDLNKYRTVTIWCRRFGVNFGSAPLAVN